MISCTRGPKGQQLENSWVITDCFPYQGIFNLDLKTTPCPNQLTLFASHTLLYTETHCQHSPHFLCAFSPKEIHVEKVAYDSLQIVKKMLQHSYIYRIVALLDKEYVLIQCSSNTIYRHQENALAFSKIIWIFCLTELHWYQDAFR